MAQIYQLPSGLSVYDVGGKTINAKTGMEVGTDTAPSPLDLNQVNQTRTPGLISSTKGQDIIAEKQKKELALVGTPITPTAPSQEKPTVQEKAPSTSLTIINPQTEQTMTFGDASINKDTIQQYLNSGWSVSEANGAIPSWLTPKQNGAFATTPTTEVDTAKAELDSAKNNLINLNVENDPALKQMLANISQQWDARIADMEQANKSRQASLSTTGIRLGSRYTGGMQGMFGGIISAEESQASSRIATLQSQKSQALLEARNAYQNQQWTKYAKLVDIAQKAYSDQLDAVKELNKAQAEQNQKIKDQVRISGIEQAVSSALGLGVSDAKDIFDAISKSETLSSFNASSKEVKEALANLTGETSMDKLGTDVRDFTYFKNSGLLPDSISSLPENQQFFAWQKANKDATTSDPSTRYQVITDPVSGEQSIFDRQAGSFIGGQPSGTNNMAPADALILNAAKTLAVKDPSGGKLLVRTVNDKLQQGDTEGAMKFIKDSAYNGLDTTTKNAYDQYESSIQLTQQAINLANSSNMSAGPWKALYESKKPYALIDRDPKYAGLKQIIAQADAQIRRGFFGTAVTATEGGTANAFLFDPTDTMPTIKQKLRGNLAFFSFLNDAEIARTTGLPKPDLNEYYAKFGVDLNNLGGLDQDLLTPGGGASKVSETNRGGI